MGRSYERAYTGSMAERSSACDLTELKQQLESLVRRHSDEELGADSGRFCSDFCKLVEEHASCWRLPLPQLSVLEIALCYFVRVSHCFASNCDPAQNTISSLALSVFELLLFFDQKDLCQEPLKKFASTFQECHLVLAKFHNVHVLQVERLVQGGGPWASPALQAILSESHLPQNEVDAYISSELPVFFELRVRYLKSCGRVAEAAALAKCCIRHATAEQHLFFLQVYLTWLHKTSQHDHLYKEVADINGKDAVYLICSMEFEEKDELLLALSTAFLSQQLRRGDMYYLCDLVLVWTNLHSRLNTPKQVLLADCCELMTSATNVKSIFPFIKAVLQEVGQEGVQFCIELCANALQACPPCEVTTKSLIYKTIAGLLPNDLEVCRACALLVFFLERTVESYKMVYLLYMHPDQEYHAEDSPIGNHVRFETLQVLKKDLHFDPEFWNLIALRTSCLKLMSEKVVSAALEEITEDKWISKYFGKEPPCRSGSSHMAKKGKLFSGTQKRNQSKPDDNVSPKRLKPTVGRPRLSDHAKRRGDRGARVLQESSKSLRRSFWQLDGVRGNVALRYEDQRRTTRLSEKNPPKRKIRKPRWLLEDSGALEENVPVRMKKHRLKRGKHLRSRVLKCSDPAQIKKRGKLKPLVNCRLKARENIKHQNGYSGDHSGPPSPPQVVLELSLPDNELMATFTEEACNRPRVVPQVLFYKSTVKFPAVPAPEKVVNGKEVILRAQGPTMLVQQLHCYQRRQRAKGGASGVQASASTITRSSLQNSAPKESKRGLSQRTSLHRAAARAPQAAHKNSKAPSRKLSLARKFKKDFIAATEQKAAKTSVSESFPRVSRTKKISESISSAHSLPDVPPVCEEVTVPSEKEATQTPTEKLCEDVEMRIIVASQSPITDSLTQSVESLPQTPTSKTSMKLSEGNPLLINVNASNSENQSPVVSPFKDTGSIGGKQDVTHQAVFSQGEESQSITSPESLPKHDTVLEDIVTSTKQVSSEPSERVSISCTPLLMEVDKRAETESKSPDQICVASTSSNSPQEHASIKTENIKQEDTAHDISSNCPETEDPQETYPESEESVLEFSCFFCNKEFKGCRVIAHAMFHFRKDECMFCGILFTDDLLAMIHMSDHIEMLKMIKGVTRSRKVKENRGRKGKASSSKAKTANKALAPRKLGRPRKLSICQKQEVEQDSGESRPRTRRSEGGQTSKTLSEKQNADIPHRINGHVSKRRVKGASSTVDAKEELVQEEVSHEDLECSEGETRSSKVHKGADVTKKLVEPQERMNCPVDGCSWYTERAKKKVAFLYHTLEQHQGDLKPLELAFQAGDGKCGICMRVMFSFEHFRHHVERHIDVPRHPCLHQGCHARFKSGMEMRRHARKHNPLQAMCCLPGCSQLFICLWALNLHEKKHFSVKAASPGKKQAATTGKKTPAGKKHLSEEEMETANEDASEGMPDEAAEEAGSEPGGSIQTQEEVETKDGSDLANPEKLDSQEPAAFFNLRRRTKLSPARKAQTPAIRKLSSSKMKPKYKKKLRDQKTKRRGRPPKMAQPADDVSSEPSQAEEEKSHVDVLDSPVQPVDSLDSITQACERIKPSLNHSKTTKPKIQKTRTSKQIKPHGTINHKRLSNASSVISDIPNSGECLLTNKHTKSVDDCTNIDETAAAAVAAAVSPAVEENANAQDDLQPSNQGESIFDDPASKAVQKIKHKRSVLKVKSKCCASPDLTKTKKKKLIKTTSKDVKKHETTSRKRKLEVQSQSSSTELLQAAGDEAKGRITDVDSEATTSPQALVTSTSDSEQVLATTEVKKMRKKQLSVTKKLVQKKEKKIKRVKVNNFKQMLVKTLVRPSVQSENIESVNCQPELMGEHPEGQNQTTLSETLLPANTDLSDTSEQMLNEFVKTSVCKETLALYSKKPYLRVPPTAYLDEKYTAMPKRRKVFVCQPPNKSAPPERPSGTSGATAVKRQRCAKCFATFCTVEELQGHLQRQKCSNLFGFDSDDEGNV